MSMHSDRQHHDYLEDRADGSIWPALLVFGAMAVLAAVAWASA